MKERRYFKIDIDKSTLEEGWLKPLLQKWKMKVKNDGEHYAAWNTKQGIFITGEIGKEGDEYKRPSLHCFAFRDNTPMTVAIEFLEDIRKRVEYIDGLDIGTNWLHTRYSDFPDWMWEDVDAEEREGL